MDTNIAYDGLQNGSSDKPVQRSDVPSNPFVDFYKHYRYEQIMKEFRCIAEHPVQGVYVIPSFKSLQIWHGVVFVKSGLYDEGIFHFKVILDDDYPYSKPTVRFASNVFHPQVSSKGTLNIHGCLSSKGKGQIWSALKYTRDCFHSLDLSAACNDDVLNTINKSSDEFRALIRGCVLESLYEFEEQAMASIGPGLEAGNPFNAKLLSQKECQLIREGLVDQLEHRDDDDEGLLGWTRNAIGKVWSNLSQYAPDSLNSPRESNEQSSSPSKSSPKKKSPERKTSKQESPSPKRLSPINQLKNSIFSSKEKTDDHSPGKYPTSPQRNMLNGHSHF